MTRTAVVFKSVFFLLMLGPLLWLGWLVALEVQAPTTALGADPGEAVVHFLGEWAIRALLVAFSVTPVYRLTRFAPVARVRRMAGLFGFAYVVLHLLAFVYFYLQFDWRALVWEIIDRPYITAGLAALLCLLPMALTSTRGWQRRLRRNWQRLHRLIYPALGLALLHLWWLTKDGYGEVLLYSIWFAVLVGARVWRKLAPAPAASSA